ncbi:MAG TPA: response regulator [Rhizomicrobium sp.]|jgi:DNA-binding response OmpR family regulator|nr:response regulator [Rhizomicrobium sp.]
MTIRVLVIDPDSRILHEVSQYLAFHGYSVVTAAAGDEGLRRFRAFAPEVVVTELLMPEKDGIECLLQIKHEAPRTKVLAVSAGEGLLGSEFVLSLAVKLGADGVLKKPFTCEQLAHAIQSIFPGSPGPPPQKL